MKLVSACLLGVRCAWSGDARYLNQRALELCRTELLVPVCPELLGGLPVPRVPQEIWGGSGEDVIQDRGRVFNKEGLDVTEHFIKGAEETLRIARQFYLREFIGKSGSPSCGCGWVYDGSFSGRVTTGDGVTTALLRRSGIRIIPEEDL